MVVLDDDGDADDAVCELLPHAPARTEPATTVAARRERDRGMGTSGLGVDRVVYGSAVRRR